MGELKRARKSAHRKRQRKEWAAKDWVPKAELKARQSAQAHPKSKHDHNTPGSSNPCVGCGDDACADVVKPEAKSGGKKMVSTPSHEWHWQPDFLLPEQPTSVARRCMGAPQKTGSSEACGTAALYSIVHAPIQLT